MLSLSFDERGVMASNDGGEALVAAIYPTWKNGSWWKKATTVTENGETKLWKKVRRISTSPRYIRYGSCRRNGLTQTFRGDMKCRGKTLMLQKALKIVLASLFLL